MKNSFILLIAAYVVSGAIISTQIANNLRTTCPSNPFLAYLQTHVSLFGQPKPGTTNRCGDEWKRFGLCCDETDLVRFVKADQQKITQAAEGFLSNIIEFKNTYGRILKIALKPRADEIERLRAGPKTIMQFIRGENSKTFQKNIERQLSAKLLSKNLIQCWKKVEAARSSALCSICSGRSETFFSEDKRIVMVDTDCNQLLRSCAPAFETTVEILEELGRFFISFEAALEQSPCPNLLTTVSYFKSLVAEIEQKRLLQNFKSYSEAHGSEKLKHAAGLCSSFLNIRGTTFIENAKTILEDMTFTKFETQVNFIHSLVLKIRENTSSIQTALPQRPVQNQQPKNPTNRRSLSKSNFDIPQSVPTASELLAGVIRSKELPKLETLFTGDVNVVAKNVDSSYSSYLGSNGTTGASHISGIPLNLTHAFP